MAIKLCKCTNCEWTGKKLFSNKSETKTCPECGSLLEVDKVSTIKSGLLFDRIPGGYEDTKLTEKIQSEEGQYQQAAFLSGESRTAY